MKCKHEGCNKQAIKGYEFCRYCLIWMIAHTGWKQEHIHCKKTAYGCYCRCGKLKKKKLLKL